jgi:hypothetical protein
MDRTLTKDRQNAYEGHAHRESSKDTHIIVKFEV